MLPRSPSSAYQPPMSTSTSTQVPAQNREPICTMAALRHKLFRRNDQNAPQTSQSRKKIVDSPMGSGASSQRSSRSTFIFQDINLDDQRSSPPTQAEVLSRLPKLRKWSIFSCSCLLQFLLNLDMAAVAVALPNIAKALNADQVLVFTVATGYLLAQTVFQLVFSHISHAVGRKYAYLSGVSLFTIGAIFAANSQTPQQLIGARVLQGIGAAGMFTMSAIVVVDIMQPRQRAAWTAVSQAYGALGNICGPLFAALLFKKYSWRSVFVMEIVAAGTLFVALVCLLPNWHNRTTTILEVLRRCDWLGMFAFFLSSVTILISINIGGTVQPWSSPAVVICLVIGTLSLGVLIYHQRYLAENPAFPRQVFTKPVTNVAFFGSLVSGMLLSMIFYNLVLFWEGVRHLPTMQIGIMLLAVTLPYTVAAALTGVAIKMWGHIKWATIAGTACAEIGLGLMYFLTEKAPVGPLIVITMLAAIGCGIYLPAMINTILASTDREWHSHAIAMRTQLYTAGQCMGISIGLAIFTNKFDYQVENSHDSVAITPQGLMRIIKDLPHDSKIITLIVNALRWVWGAACVVGFVAGIPACVLKCPPLPVDDHDNQGQKQEPVSQNSAPKEGEGLLHAQDGRPQEVKRRAEGESFEAFKMLVLPRPQIAVPTDSRQLLSATTSSGSCAHPIQLSTVSEKDEEEPCISSGTANDSTPSSDPAMTPNDSSSIGNTSEVIDETIQTPSDVERYLEHSTSVWNQHVLAASFEGLRSSPAASSKSETVSNDITTMDGTADCGATMRSPPPHRGHESSSPRPTRSQGSESVGTGSTAS